MEIPFGGVLRLLGKFHDFGKIKGVRTLFRLGKGS
jgi:hypothetical protein